MDDRGAKTVDVQFEDGLHVLAFSRFGFSDKLCLHGYAVVQQKVKRGHRLHNSFRYGSLQLFIRKSFEDVIFFKYPGQQITLFAND